MLVTIAFSKQRQEANKKGSVLAADVGATKTNLGIFIWDQNNFVCKKEAEFKTREMRNFEVVLKEFLSGSELPDSICMGVAGPVSNGKVNITNLPLELDSKVLSQGLKRPVLFINDLEATAYGLGALTHKDVYVLQEGNSEQKGNAAVIAPGTGLGEAGLYWDGNNFHPFATEGGHVDFAPRDETDVGLYHYLHKKFGHVSWERVVSGPGIALIYDFLIQEKGLEEPQWLKEKLQAHDKAQVISDHYKSVPSCTEAIDLFFRYLSSEAANLVLKLKATGGLYIGGGIVPKLKSLIDSEVFKKNFCNSGRLGTLLKEVPVVILLNDKTALLGAAWYGRYNACEGS